MRNIIITGGELFNKGAQAMTFVTVNEIKKRYPNHQIYLLSEMDFARPQEERAIYAFDFTGWYPIKFAKCQRNPLLRMLCLIRNRQELAKAEAIYNNCDAMIDISGYALGSNWSTQNNNRYLNHLEFAQSFGIPVYLMPQSFGPFDFGAEHPGVDERCRKLLPSCKAILAREQEGYDALISAYGLTNVRLATDLVLNNKGIDLNNIFKTVPAMELPEIKEESVAVIPNSMNASVSSQDTTVTMYTQIVEKLLSLNRTVYLLSHSTMDAALCRTLKAHFRDNDSVILLEQDFSCLEFNELVQKFRYLVASRFHSIVHAYKNGIPCVALGWATKYHDLLKLFGQEQYVFDIRSQAGTADIMNAINRMDDCHPLEAARIRQSLAAVQKENVFDVLSNG